MLLIFTEDFVKTGLKFYKCFSAKNVGLIRVRLYIGGGRIRGFYVVYWCDSIQEQSILAISTNSEVMLIKRLTIHFLNQEALGSKIAK